MLEIPESYTIAKQLKAGVAGKTIRDVVAAQSPHGFAWYFGEPSEYTRLLSGKRIVDARAVAGQVEIIAEDMRILLQDGVNIRYLDSSAKPPDKHQLYITFDDGCGVACTVQMYGGLYAYPEGANDNIYYKVAVQKPSPLSDDFNETYFEQLVREAKPKLSAKALLAAEQRIPGLGNGCLQDILYRSGVNPQTKLSALSSHALQALYTNTKQTLAEMAARGGRDTEKDLYGKEGGYKTLLSHKTAAYACPRCGSGIIRKAYMGGNVYFCPECQPLLG